MTEKRKLLITPNVLTNIRFVFAALAIWMICAEEFSMRVWGGIFFLLAVVTDFFDGFIARKYNLVSNYGKIADPIADKVLILGMYCAYAYLGVFSYAWVIPIAIREILVTLLRLGLLSRGSVIAAENMGKYKVGFQVASLIAAWLLVLFQDVPQGSVYAYYVVAVRMALYATLMCALLLTILSGVSFLMKNERAIADMGIARLCANFFLCGKAPFAPGTVGSLGGVVLYLIVRASGFFWTALALVCFIGVWSARYVSEKLQTEDPGEVVIDEVAGVMITFLFVPFSPWTVVIGFVLFRFFDIFKPWPIRALEKLPHGYGIMADDLMAGVYANIVLRLLQYYFLF